MNLTWLWFEFGRNASRFVRSVVGPWIAARFVLRGGSVCEVAQGREASVLRRLVRGLPGVDGFLEALGLPAVAKGQDELVGALLGVVGGGGVHVFLQPVV